MSRQNNRFGSEPISEPEWMKEFAKGGGPSLHREEASWPVNGLAGYNAVQGTDGQSAPEARPGSRDAGPTLKRIARRESRVAKRPAGAGAGKKLGGCGCEGQGQCGGQNEGGRAPGLPIAPQSAIGAGNAVSSGGSPGAMPAVPSSAPDSMAESSASSRAPAVVFEAELVTLAKDKLATDGISMSEEQVAKAVSTALASVFDLVGPRTSRSSSVNESLTSPSTGPNLLVERR